MSKIKFIFSCFIVFYLTIGRLGDTGVSLSSNSLTFIPISNAKSPPVTMPNPNIKSRPVPMPNPKSHYNFNQENKYNKPGIQESNNNQPGIKKENSNEHNEPGIKEAESKYKFLN